MYHFREETTTKCIMHYSYDYNYCSRSKAKTILCPEIVICITGIPHPARNGLFHVHKYIYKSSSMNLLRM